MLRDLMGGSAQQARAPGEANSHVHPFDEAIALQPLEGHRWRGHTSPAYANMIGPYGGITAAQALNSVLQHPQRLGDPVVLTVNFAAALSDGPYVIDARPARTNRSTQHWIIEMSQGEQIVLTGTAVTALRRDTWSASEAELPQVPRPAAVPLPQGRGAVEWIKRYEMRVVDGHVPAQWDGADHGHSQTRLWMRDQPARPLDFTSLTAMADVFFPRIWRRRAKLTPLGTVSMTLYYHASAHEVEAVGKAYLLGQAQGQSFGGGYFDHSGQLWNEAGSLLATTHQIVYFKE